MKHHELPELLRDNRLRIHYQPIVSMDSGDPIGYEALTRGPAGTVWEAPLTLFQAATEAGLLQDLECHVRTLAVNSYRWGPDLPKLFINFNPIVPCGLTNPAAHEGLCMQCDECPLVKTLYQFRDQIVLELPERLVIQRLPHIGPLLAQLRALGISLALDDFGSGVGDLERLLFVRPDWIKLDRCLIRGIDADPWQQAVVRQMVGLQEQIGVTLIAEGVETGAELETLSRLGVRFAQGFFLGRPSPELRMTRQPVSP